MIVERWQNWAREHELEPLFAELMALHYDPHYARSQERHLLQWRQRVPVLAENLSVEGIDALAQRLGPGKARP